MAQISNHPTQPSFLTSKRDGCCITAHVEKAVRQLAQSALDVHGRIDILVNNAGFQHVAPVEQFPDALWAKLIHVMLIAPFQLIKYYLVTGMKKRGRDALIICRRYTAL